MVLSLLNSLFTPSINTRIESIRNAERTLLQLANRFGNSNDSSILEIFDTEIKIPALSSSKQSCQLFGSHKDEEENYVIHGIRAKSKDANNDSKEPPLVLLHGYANGALYYYRNFLGLNQHYPKIFAIDMLGWGLSSRPSHSFTDVESAESFFVESLEAWRRKNNIDKMILGGHSLGGYVGVAYCEKYPERVHRLILISPVGVPHKEDAKLPPDASMKIKMLVSFARTCWVNGITPGSFLRTIPESRGRRMVEGYVQHRLPAVSCETEQSVLSEYLYQNAILPGSGEYCLNALLRPMAYARKPTVHRIPQLQVPHIDFLYGERDWMDVAGGMEVQRLCEDIVQRGGRAPSVKIATVESAGHLLMLENWQQFNEAMIGTATGGNAMLCRNQASLLVDESKVDVQLNEVSSPPTSVPA